MSEAYLQILLILAYLAIGLISITFPIYAICVTYLRQEKWESGKEREKRIANLRVKISELTAELNGEKHDSERITRLKEQIGRYESELKGTELGVHCLTAKGAVGKPVSYLALALLTIGVSIYFFNLEELRGAVAFGFISALLSAMAVSRLYKTIRAVEYAALRPARTIEFNVVYASGKNSEEIKHGKETDLCFGAGTVEETLENFIIYAYLPPEIELMKIKSKRAASTIQPPSCKHPNYTMLSIKEPFFPKHMYRGITVTVKPKKLGKYIIPVQISAKGIYEVEKELILNVVK